MKVRYNTSIEEKKKDAVKRFTNMRRILGEDVTEGDILDEALEVYGIEDRCIEAMKKIQQTMLNK
jgi:hypothetical protein